MAEAVRFVCSDCGKTIEAWSDGNPYYIDENGQKQYAYHPDHENLARCIGNDSPHLCLDCGDEFLVDSRTPRLECPQCGEKDIVSTFELDGRPCPYCKKGAFHMDRNFLMIS